MSAIKPIDTQLRLEDVSLEYREFIEKFKPKKTTDDCYTPDNIFQTVQEWACEEYGIDPANIVRPFWPGGDYERYQYKEDSVVVDNPPFSIITNITRFYNQHEIPFFLFSPYLTNLGIGRGAKNVQHIITGTSIIYQNGAEVGTSFVTNMDKWFLRTAPDLAERIKAENKKNLASMKRKVPKYNYPHEVITSSALGYLASHGVTLKIAHEETFFVRSIESQKATGKTLFGSGFLLSERAAAERVAAERAAAERAAAERAAAERAAAERAKATAWELSEKEWEIIKSLGGDGDGAEWSITKVGVREEDV